MERKKYENEKNNDNDELTLKYKEIISSNEINIHKIPVNNNKKSKIKNNSKYLDSSLNIEKNNTINLKKMIRNNSINRQKIISKKIKLKQ